MQSDIEHIQEIEIASQQGSASRDPLVVQSWLRCLDKHGLDPTTRAEAYILPDAALRQHRQRSEDLIRIARSGIDDLYQLVAGQNYVLLLSDAEGVTVEYLGEDVQKSELRRSGLYLGAEWSEARAGTCALGACIETGEPLIIHQSDHFDVTHGGLSCTAAPIYDTAGSLAAVLDISLLSSPLARTSQLLALNLVRQTARRIEMANIMAESRGDWVLRLAGSPDFLDVDPQAALRLDAGGHVIGMTNGAARLMARALDQDWRKGKGLIGRHVSEVFNLDVETLEGLTRQHAARDRLIETRDGYRLFAHAIEPRRTPTPFIAPARALPPELRDLAGEDPVMRQIAETSAVLAHGKMPLLIEGPCGCGKSALARAIHAIGRRGPLVTVACETIAEDEAAVLFGRGDPRGHVAGLIAAAEGGTLVLDNLEELPPRLQARLASLLAEGRYRPVGALRERASTARIIVTSRGLAAGEGLRSDLFHRLSGARQSLPALAQRQDIIGLASKLFTRAFAAPVSFDPAAASALTRHPWPGNLHDLQALAQSLAASLTPRPASGLVVGLAHLPAHLQGDSADAQTSSPAMLRHLLAEHGWNISAVASTLGVDRSTIHRRMARHGLSRDAKAVSRRPQAR
ncbi:MAG: sigma-54-dependent Fis family transcriptional regulator [Cypionkella sp.]